MQHYNCTYVYSKVLPVGVKPNALVEVVDVEAVEVVVVGVAVLNGLELGCGAPNPPNPVVLAAVVAPNPS